MKRIIAFGAFIVLMFSLTFYLNPGMYFELSTKPEKELLIYCGITMIQPMSEIASIIESQEGVKISIIKGGSGNLLQSIKTYHAGDLYLPGSEYYMELAIADGLVGEFVEVGYNKAAMMVQKGNPKGIPQDLHALKSADFHVVIGNPDSGSIGKETKKILSSIDIFDDVLKNVREMTTDSKDLVDVLINGEADLVINWYATSTWAANKDYIDALSINGAYAARKQLLLGLLESSKYPETARLIMSFASSEEGNKIFDRYGLYHVE